MTSTTTSIKSLETTVEPGVSVAQALRDSAIIALQTNVTVVLKHNQQEFTISPQDILRVLASQSPAITGKHRLPQKP